MQAQTRTRTMRATRTDETRSSATRTRTIERRQARELKGGRR